LCGGVRLDNLRLHGEAGKGEKMKYLYKAHVDGKEEDFEEVSSSVFEPKTEYHIEFIAEKAAAALRHNTGEYNDPNDWPIKIDIFTGKKELLGCFEVCLDYEPTFGASRVVE